MTRVIILIVASLFCVSSANTVKAGVITSGLVGYWKADGDALDSSGNGLNGTLNNGVTFAPGQFGQAFSLDGSNQWISTNQSFANDQSHTISVWVNWNGETSQTFQEIVSWWNTTDPIPNRMFLGTANSSTTQGPIRYGDGWNNVPVSIPVGQWVHLAATYDGATNDRQLFLNGSLAATLSGGPEARFSANLAIGKQGTTPITGEFWNGLIDDLALYDRVLSDAEISSNAIVPEPSNLALLAIGAVGLFGYGYRRKRRLAA